MYTPPRLRFAHLPTPIEPLPRLSAHLGGPQLWVKRDDQTGLAFGGNKTRKLEFLIAEAQAHGARTLITAGAAQSNHCRQTAAAAARFGLDCILVLSGDPPAHRSGNLLLDDLLGAEIVWATRVGRNAILPKVERNAILPKVEQNAILPKVEQNAILPKVEQNAILLNKVPAGRDEALQQVFQTAWEAGRRPYLIPYGGSNPTGATAYAFALQEMLEQLCDDRRPDWIVFASSSGGTQAGLVLGARLFDFRGGILGISVDEAESVLNERAARLATETADFLGENFRFSPGEIRVNADYLGGGYGVVGEPEREAIRLFARYEGLLLDPVYTGRAAAGMIDLIRRGFFSPNQVVLFWHTGGTPALFALQGL